MEMGVTGEEDGFGDVAGDDIEWVFSAKEGYFEVIKFFL